jgi:hypothetical protein
MAIESGGNVGIGTTGPDTLLHIEGGELTVQGSGANAKIHLKDSAGNTDGYIYAASAAVGFLDDDGEWAYRHTTDTDHVFFINDTAKLNIANTKISGSSTSTGSFGQLHLGGGTAANPSLNFGDGDSGLYESSDDVLDFAFAGSRKYLMQGTHFASNISYYQQTQNLKHRHYSHITHYLHLQNLMMGSLLFLHLNVIVQTNQLKLMSHLFLY